jgi:CRP-like cAMP-binding protein
MQRFQPERFLARIECGQQIVNFKTGEVVYQQGGPAPSIFFLQSGRVIATVSAANGKEAITAMIEPGMFFGVNCLDNNVVRMSRITAITPSTALEITKDAMLALIRKSPEFAELFVTFLVQRNSFMMSSLTDQLFNSSEKRLARILLMLSHFGEKDGPNVISGDISQEMIAEMIGSTRPRVNYHLRRFREMGFVNYDGCIEVNGELLNAALQANEFDRKPNKLL